jgi:hypothetical protein
MIEVKRVENVPTNTAWYDSKCIVCRKKFTLFFNGGELDSHDCCGHTYKLEVPRIDFVICKD